MERQPVRGQRRGEKGVASSGRRREGSHRFSSFRVAAQDLHEHLSDSILELCGPRMLISDELFPQVCGGGSHFGIILLHQHQRAQSFPNADRPKTIVGFGQGLVLQ
jgi:hypothetical protein